MSGRQASLYHARERRRDRGAQPLELARTHVLTAAQGSIDTGAIFPNRVRALTLSLDVRRDTSGSNGLLFEFGDSTRGFAAALDGDDLIVAAGGAAAGTDGVTLTIADILPAVGLVYRLSFAVVPGLGRVVAWSSGKRIGQATATDGSFGASGWGTNGAGRIGNVQGTVIDRIPVGQRAALTNATIIGAVSCFDGQRPRGIQ